MRIKIRTGRLLCALLCVSQLFLVTGCRSAGAEAAPDQQFLTNKATAAGKLPITIMCKFGVAFDQLEAAAEAKFPDLDLIITNNHAFDPIVELDARMRADDLPDIVTLPNPELLKSYFPDRLLDLSALPFVERYNISSLNALTDQGCLYLLPGPAQIRGLVYNKTAFAELGLPLPASFEEFVSLCKEIETHGMRSVRFALADDSLAEFTFNGFGYAPCFSMPADDQWLADYNAGGQGSFYAHMKPALDNYQTLLNNGLIRPEDFDYPAYSRPADLANRSYLITEDSPAMITQLEGLTSDEFGLMPYFSGSQDSRWLNTISPIYFGLNRHLADAGSEEKYALALQVLDFISSEEGQQALFKSNIGGLSCVKFMPPAPQPGVSELADTIELGQYSSFSKWRSDLLPLFADLFEQMAKGAIDAVQFGAAMDEAASQPAAPPQAQQLGTAQTDFSPIDTGCFVADALRAETGADLALFADSGKDGYVNYVGLSATLYQGPITETDVQRILPLTISNIPRTVNVATMSGQQVADALECLINDSPSVFYPSGLCFTYAPTAPFEQRVQTITNPDGTPFDLTKRYTVAVLGESLPADAYQSLTVGTVTVDEAVEQAIRQAQTIQPAGDGRFLLVDPQ